MQAFTGVLQDNRQKIRIINAWLFKITHANSKLIIPLTFETGHEGTGTASSRRTGTPVTAINGVARTRYTVPIIFGNVEQGLNFGRFFFGWSGRSMCGFRMFCVIYDHSQQWTKIYGDRSVLRLRGMDGCYADRIRLLILCCFRAWGTLYGL